MRRNIIISLFATAALVTACSASEGDDGLPTLTTDGRLHPDGLMSASASASKSATLSASTSTSTSASPTETTTATTTSYTTASPTETTTATTAPYTTGTTTVTTTTTTTTTTTDFSGPTLSCSGSISIPVQLPGYSGTFSVGVSVSGGPTEYTVSASIGGVTVGSGTGTVSSGAISVSGNSIAFVNPNPFSDNFNLTGSFSWNLTGVTAGDSGSLGFVGNIPGIGNRMIVISTGCYLYVTDGGTPPSVLVNGTIQ
jgi:hypothetical protein